LASLSLGNRDVFQYPEKRSSSRSPAIMLALIWILRQPEDFAAGWWD
jgi:hypothetical protein